MKFAHYFNDNKAFTLLEAIFSLFIISLLCIAILYFMNIINANNNNNYYDRELILFIEQAQEDFIESSKIEIINNELIFTTFLNDKISYSQQKDKVIRTVNGKGYEVMLNGVDKIKFSKNKGTIYYNILFKNEKNKKGILGHE